MRTAWPALALLLAPLPAAAEAGAPSFSCAKAGSSVEAAICADPALSRLDADLARRFTATLAADPAGKATLLDAQRAWLASRSECRPADPTKPGEVACLANRYRRRLADLASRDPRDVPICQAVAARIREKGGTEKSLTKDLPRLLAEDAGAPIRFDLRGEDLTPALRAKLPNLDESQTMNASVQHFGGSGAFFAVNSVQGTANCQFVALFKIVSGGAVQSLPPPDGTEPGCPEDTFFASTAEPAPVPLYIEANDDLSRASMRLWSRRDDAWHAMCAIEVRYRTRLALIERSCADGADCEALAAAATSLAEARDRVAGDEAPKRLGTAELIRIDDDKSREDVPSFGDVHAKGGIGTFEFSAPVYRQPGPHGPIALRISHDTLGWRTFENWLVGIYDPGEDMKPLAGFEFKKSRDALRDVSLR